MNIELRPDYPVTDEACKAASGKTLQEWSDLISANSEIADKRRPAIAWISETTSRNTEGAWWATTIWVEHERRIGRVQKDGRLEGYNICATKTIAASPERVQEALRAELGNVTRERVAKDTRATWRTPGTDADTEIEVLFAANGGKTGVTLNHKRIGTRDEADGLRRFWSERLSKLKAQLEA